MQRIRVVDVMCMYMEAVEQLSGFGPGSIICRVVKVSGQLNCRKIIMVLVGRSSVS